MNDTKKGQNEREEGGAKKPFSAIDEEIRCGRWKEEDRDKFTHLMGPKDVVETFPEKSNLYSMDILYVFLEGEEAQVWSNNDPSFVMELRAPDTRVTLVVGPSRQWKVRLPDRTALVPWVWNMSYQPITLSEEDLRTFTEDERRMYDRFHRSWFPPKPGIKKTDDYEGGRLFRMVIATFVLNTFRNL